jgi:hypothetical protein
MLSSITRNLTLAIGGIISLTTARVEWSAEENDCHMTPTYKTKKKRSRKSTNVSNNMNKRPRNKNMSVLINVPGTI